jgi:hypothetical protein
MSGQPVHLYLNNNGVWGAATQDVFGQSAEQVDDAIEAAATAGDWQSAAQVAAAVAAEATARDAAIAAATPNLNTISEAVAVTATADGTGTGTVPDGVDFATVTCDDAAKIVTLPAPVPGTVVTLRNGATGYELRTSAPATVKINGGSGASAESAIGANLCVVCLCDTSTTWLCSQTTAAGETTPVEAAA